MPKCDMRVPRSGLLRLEKALKRATRLIEDFGDVLLTEQFEAMRLSLAKIKISPKSHPQLFPFRRITRSRKHDRS
jgi:hypothetical protein